MVAHTAVKPGMKLATYCTNWIALPGLDVIDCHHCALHPVTTVMPVIETSRQSTVTMRRPKRRGRARSRGGSDVSVDTVRDGRVHEALLPRVAMTMKRNARAGATERIGQVCPSGG